MNGARYKYLDKVCELVNKGEDIVIVSADYAAPSLDDFRVEHPDRYVSVGIAEQNLIQVATGIAMTGTHTIAYGLAPFTCTRAFDQIRNATSLMNIPLQIVASGAGFAIPEFGATHYVIDDVSMLRTIPNMNILNVTDNIMAEKATELLMKSTAPYYIRFDKYVEGQIYKENDIDFSKGYSVLNIGCDVTIVTYGYYTKRVLDLLSDFNKKEISVKVIDLYRLPFNTDEFIKDIKDSSFVLTVEEHVLEGGIGSIVLELLSDKNVSLPIERMGICLGDKYPSTFGNREHFMKEYGLDDENILKRVESGIMKYGK